MPFLSDRALLKALLVSLSAHALLLLEVAPLLPVTPEAPRAAISVSMQRAGRGAPLPPVREPEPKAAEKPAVPKIPEKNKAAKVLAVREQPSSTIVVPPPSVLAEDQDAVAAPTASVPAKGSASGTAGRSLAVDVQKSGAGVQPPGQEGLSADEVRQYRTSLAISAKRFKRYPALAREREWEGRVEIALDFRRLRPVPELSVASSSGKKILDDQALEMILQATRVTDLPASLRDRDFQVLVPIIFNLNDER